MCWKTARQYCVKNYSKNYSSVVCGSLPWKYKFAHFLYPSHRSWEKRWRKFSVDSNAWWRPLSFVELFDFPLWGASQHLSLSSYSAVVYSEPTTSVDRYSYLPHCHSGTFQSHLCCTSLVLGAKNRGGSNSWCTILFVNCLSATSSTNPHSCCHGQRALLHCFHWSLLSVVVSAVSLFVHVLFVLELPNLYGPMHWD